MPTTAPPTQLPPAYANLRLGTTASGLFVPNGTAVQAAPGETLTASGIIIPAPKQFDTPSLVTAKPMSTGDLLATLKQLHGGVAATESSDMANFRFARSIELAERVDRDARREALVERLKASQLASADPVEN